MKKLSGFQSLSLSALFLTAAISSQAMDEREKQEIRKGKQDVKEGKPLQQNRVPKQKNVKPIEGVEFKILLATWTKKEEEKILLSKNGLIALLNSLQIIQVPEKSKLTEVISKFEVSSRPQDVILYQLSVNPQFLKEQKQNVFFVKEVSLEEYNKALKVKSEYTPTLREKSIHTELENAHFAFFKDNTQKYHYLIIMPSADGEVMATLVLNSIFKRQEFITEMNKKNIDTLHWKSQKGFGDHYLELNRVMFLLGKAVGKLHAVNFIPNKIPNRIKGLIHSDLYTNNIFYDESTKQITFIDSGDLKIGNIEEDLKMLFLREIAEYIVTDPGIGNETYQTFTTAFARGYSTAFPIKQQETIQTIVMKWIKEWYEEAIRENENDIQLNFKLAHIYIAQILTNPKISLITNLNEIFDPTTVSIQNQKVTVSLGDIFFSIGYALGSLHNHHFDDQTRLHLKNGAVIELESLKTTLQKNQPLKISMISYDPDSKVAYFHRGNFKVLQKPTESVNEAIKDLLSNFYMIVSHAKVLKETTGEAGSTVLLKSFASKFSEGYAFAYPTLSKFNIETMVYHMLEEQIEKHEEKK